jgi:hypothetical protein
MMVKMGEVIDALKEGLKREVKNVASFVTAPTGVFETVDAIVKDARRTARETVDAVLSYFPRVRGYLKR